MWIIIQTNRKKIQGQNNSIADTDYCAVDLIVGYKINCSRTKLDNKSGVNVKIDVNYVPYIVETAVFISYHLYCVNCICKDLIRIN